MATYITGKGSKFYLGKDKVTALTEADYVTRLTNIGENISEYNMIDIEAELDATTQSKIAGLTLANEFEVTGNLTVEDNAGYEILKSAHESKKAVKYGITRPEGIDGIGGECFINRISISEATNEGVMTYTATVTTSGDVELFELTV